MGRFLRGRAVLAALVLAILAAGVLPGGQTSAHGYGTIGVHDHGKIYCGSGGRIVVHNVFAQAYNRTGNVDHDEVYYKALLFKWNPSTRNWVYVKSGPWHKKLVSDFGAHLPTTSFYVGRGLWAVKTAIYWYDGELDGILNNGGINAYLGHSPITWTQGWYCTYY